MNKSVKRGRNRSGRELGGKRAVSGCVKVVVGWILVTHDGNGGLRSCDHRHGVSVKNGGKRWYQGQDGLGRVWGSEFWADNKGGSLISVFRVSYIYILKS